MMPTTIAALESLIRGERWAAQDQQREFDRRLAEYAEKNGIRALDAIGGVAFHIPPSDLATLKEGLDL